MKKVGKYLIIVLLLFSIIVVIIYAKSKLPNDKYHYTSYASTEEIMQNFEANKLLFGHHIHIMEKLP